MQQTQSIRTVSEIDNFNMAMITALRDRPRSISPKYFYDDIGSALFDRICDLPEYYPTRSEMDIFIRKGREIAEIIGDQVELVEFGAGSMKKVRHLLSALDSPARYLPVDISGSHLNAACAALQEEFPSLEIVPVVADYTQPLRVPHLQKPGDKRIGLFSGSTIGNFTPVEAASFMRMAAELLRGGALLLAVDLIKSPAILHSAYNDSEGVTAMFNLNVLARANREMGANFNLENFEHYAFYNVPQSRVEMHLISRCHQQIHIRGERFDFAEGESLHTENSHKFTMQSVRQLARAAGFRPGPVWTDRYGFFSLHWLRAPSL